MSRDHVRVQYKLTRLAAKIQIFDFHPISKILEAMSLPSEALAVPATQSNVATRHRKAETVTPVAPENARVSLWWKSEALALVWRQVDLSNALQVLAPLEKKGRFYVFTRNIYLDDWERFNVFYSRHVRKLTASPDKKYEPSVGHMIASTRPSFNIFPYLDTLAFETNFHLVPLFAHQNVNEMSFVIESLSKCAEVSATLPYIAPKVPCLKHLSITTNYDSSLEALIIDMVKELKQLQSLKLPSQWLTPDVTNAVALLPQLSTLETLQSARLCKSHHPEQAEEIFSLDLPQNCFPLLRSLTLRATIPRTKASLPQLKKLRTITLLPSQATSLYELLPLFTLIPQQFPCLTSLTLDFRDASGLTSARKPIPPSDLRPLFALSSLHTLHIDHTFPIQLSNDKLLGLVKKFPRLIHLSLCPHAGHKLEPTLDITVLRSLITRRPNMKYLGLHMRVPTDHGALQVDDPTVFKSTKSLSTLCIGTSPLTDKPFPVAVYLSRILPESCRLVGPETLGPLQDMFTTLIQVRKQEQSQARNGGRLSLA
ncbi:hypothetical protein AB1N83_003768 [Pleurotus pulmonarius]